MKEPALQSYWKTADPFTVCILTRNSNSLTKIQTSKRMEAKDQLAQIEGTHFHYKAERDRQFGKKFLPHVTYISISAMSKILKIEMVSFKAM